MSLKVNPNIVNRARLELAKDFNDLVKYIEENTETYTSYMGNEHTRINIDKDELGQKFDNLRHWIVTLACTYEEGNPDFRNLADEIPVVKSLYQED